jgi:HAD superfamily hydrolase (TIGR01509 family)
MKFAAVIFDLDGTIIKSERQWGKAFVAVLKKLGVDTKGRDPHTPGVDIKFNWKNLIAKYGVKTDKTAEELEILTYAEYEKFIPEISLNNGVLEFMNVLKESGLSLALATLTNWEITEKVINHFGLNNYFENITTGEEVENPKPAPDIFLLAAEKLGIDPVDCLVIEDSITGVTAAHEAGMKVIEVVDGFSKITLKAIDAIGVD